VAAARDSVQLVEDLGGAELFHFSDGARIAAVAVDQFITEQSLHFRPEQ
jgi:hypothetical protein